MPHNVRRAARRQYLNHLWNWAHTGRGHKKHKPGNFRTWWCKCGGRRVPWS